LLRIVFEDVKRAHNESKRYAGRRLVGVVAKINAARPHHDPPDYRTNQNQINYTPMRRTSRVPGFHHTGPAHA